MRVLSIGEIREATGGELLSGSEDVRVSYISIDSRDVREETLFVPLVGEKVDAHRFLEQVIADGAKAVFTARDLTEAQHEAAAAAGTAVIRVSDTLIALQALSAWHRSRLSLPLIGVTGSVGKTTTREMIAAALSAKYRVFKTKANHNSQIGVPLTLLDIEDEEIGVIEMGISRPGEMHIISELVRPSAAVVTNIGTAHLMELGSRENIRDEKLKIQDGMQKDAVLFRNADDALLLAGVLRGDMISRTYGKAETADCRAEHVRLVNGCAAFTADIRGQRVEVKLGVPGEHQVWNALAALGVAEAYGVPLEGAASELANFKGYRHRQQIFVRDGVLVIDDSYNASPDSMRAALSILREMKDRRRIAVLGDMKELGAAEIELHREIGAELAAAEGADCVFTLGELAGALAAALRENCKAAYRPELKCFTKREELFAALKETVKPGDALLFKASNSMKFSELADYFSGQGERGEH
ncbi:UDP-N-acetylmuramoyl-tripeptide--D-alanyl-D-alanine ligase [Stomatobaculum sp. F0698]|uniref:UDP-N-acetylmuramoyl-tripeptide--D-alanyl-D- alanine ligase n=1 Tax=Stomatobaculum sp. F0698 TaxID=3059030 RepID=UPI00272BDFA5|nr:UDP-N-acetylmuramoyl-tripeptide--D-alanyl-D-alanine ligase [Stomatobaculum sp. F0698]WLD85940.1 UDP-N-acetylmuramoyl-tripeptide--D-alanyl-D-alanine ligase [Stomatobaculum sp. F0698]